MNSTDFRLVSQPRNKMILADSMDELKKFIRVYLLPTYRKVGFEITEQSDTHFAWKDAKTKRVGFFQIIA
jgi:hypothetical protein